MGARRSYTGGHRYIFLDFPRPCLTPLHRDLSACASGGVWGYLADSHTATDTASILTTIFIHSHIKHPTTPPLANGLSRRSRLVWGLAQIIRGGSDRPNRIMAVALALDPARMLLCEAGQVYTSRSGERKEPFCFTRFCLNQSSF